MRFETETLLVEVPDGSMSVGDFLKQIALLTDAAVEHKDCRPPSPETPKKRPSARRGRK